MSKAPTWEKAFLQALAATGIAGQAAAAAGIGVRTASKRRETNPTFAAAWESAADLYRSEAARRAMSAAGELVRHGGGKLVRAGQTRWSKRGEEAFLTELAVTGNVKRAAAAAGFTPSCLYARRRKDRRFAEAWDAAVADARARIEAFLVEAADRTFDPASVADALDIPKMTIAEAIKVLQLAQGKCGRPSGGAAAGAERGWIGDPAWGTPEDEAEMAQVREGILGKLERLRERDEREKLEAGWTKHGDHWVPPGFAPVVDVKALPEPAEDEARGPSIRRL